VGGVPGTNKNTVPGRVLTTNGRADLDVLEIPKPYGDHLINETLSVVGSDINRTVVVSMPYSNIILAWNTDDQTFKFATKIRRPTGLGFLGHSIVAGAEDGQWFELDPGTGALKQPKFTQALAGNQTHLTLANL
jgi:hypothetical protein